MVFFQLNVTGLLFQSFRTASPHNTTYKVKFFYHSIIYVYVYSPINV